MADEVKPSSKHLPFRTVQAWRGNACIKCCKNAHETALALCSGCRRMKYCKSGPCQRDDWKAHKDYCKTWSKFYPPAFSVVPIVTAGLADGHSAADISDYLANHVLIPMAQTYERSYKETIPVAKREVTNTNAFDWLLQKAHCESCWKYEEKDSPLQVCLGCLVVAWCGSDCRSRSRHQAQPGGGWSQCQILQQAMEAERFVFNFREENPDKGCLQWAPKRVLSSPPAALPSSWNKYYAIIQRGEGRQLNPVIRVAMTSENISMTLTILTGLQRLLLGGLRAANDRKTLRIHIVGASSYEFYALMTFEEILHQLPGVQRLELEFIGPRCGGETSFGTEMGTCPDCERKGRQRIVSHIRTTYHEYFDSLPSESPSRRPDLIVAFNSGLHDESLKDSWAPTIRLLTSQGFPCLFSSLNALEAQDDKERLEDLGVELRFSEEKNVWGGEWARWDAWDNGDGFYRTNDYICGWGGSL